MAIVTALLARRRVGSDEGGAALRGFTRASMTWVCFVDVDSFGFSLFIVVRFVVPRFVVCRRS